MTLLISFYTGIRIRNNMDLVIAEKNNAARRIASILGKPKEVKKGRVTCYELDDKVVVPLRGHVKNLDFPQKYSNWKGTKLQELANAPIKYNETRRSISNAIKHYAKDSDELHIATDYDREGESIGKEAIEIAQKKNKEIPIKRAKFSSLTEEDVKKAFEDLKEFDWDLAKSADARREIDLLWGAVLTRYLSLTSGRLGKSYLSVGRVQTPTLAEIVDREEERNAFKPKTYWKIWINYTKNNKKYKAFYEKSKVFDKKKAEELKKLKADKAEVKSVRRKKYRRKPPVPFDTTQFLREASKIGFSPSAALSVAESLYQEGIISYPRTDNTRYPKSLDLKKILKELKKVEGLAEHAEKILKKKKLTPTKGKKKTTDHPPIHPVKRPHKKLNNAQWKVYKLIADRFLATLSEKSVIQTVKAKIDYADQNYKAKGKKVLKPGWEAVYRYRKTKEKPIPPLEKGEELKVSGAGSKEKKTKPRPRYSPSKLIKYMEDKGLGTKSTRPAIIKKLRRRHYISKTKGYKPSEVAFAVIKVLEKYAKEITVPNMTSKLEKEMEQVSQGEKTKEEVVKDSKKMLEEILTKLENKKEDIGDELKKALRKDKYLGKCQKCGEELVKRRNRRGKKFVGCSGYPKCTNTYPLPQKGKVTATSKTCPECGSPVIKVVRYRGRNYEMCLDPDCKTKEDWGKKSNKKEKSK